MSDMRYELRISGHELLESTSVLVEVWGHPHDLRDQAERLVRRLVDVEDTGFLEPDEWIREVVRGLAEHL